MISSSSLRNDVPIVELSSIVEFLDHKRKPITESERVTGPYPYYGANGIQDYVADWIFDEELILLAEDGGHFEDPDRGVAYKISGKSWVNNHAHVLRPTNVDVDYLKHILRNMDLMPYVNGATRLKLTKANASRIKIPLPPLAEQKRIAELLDTADRIIRLREQAIAKLDELAQSVFVDMFGNNKFPSKSLKQLGKVKTGGTPPSSKAGMFGLSIPFITPGDLENKAKPKRFLSEEGATESVVVKKGSALVCCIGATIGKMSKAKTDCAFNQQLNAVEWGEEINADFGIHALRQIKNKIIGGGSATTLPIIKKSLFEKLEIIVPPYELQIKFCERITKIEDLINISDLELVKICSLSNSLQHESFAVT
jgi:type I restriction enzyme S subunit